MQEYIEPMMLSVGIYDDNDNSNNLSKDLYPKKILSITYTEVGMVR
jgi:hypothetical protein